MTHENTTEPAILPNRTTKADLLGRAKLAVEAGEKSLHDAAELIGLAQEEHKATQREIAAAIGMSPAWVNRLLIWRRSGYEASSPFAVQRAKQKKAKAAQPKSDAGAKAEATGEEATTPTSTSQQALAEFKFAVDHRLPKMSTEDKQEALAYVIQKAGVPLHFGRK
jgi:hypothetical protein